LLRYWNSFSCHFLSFFCLFVCLFICRHH
jgi:hypothetical protein